MQDQVTYHLAFGIITTYVLEWLKKCPWFPLLNTNTDTLNRLFSVLAAFASSVGIVAASTGHLSWETGTTITLTVPSLSIIVDTTIHSIGQWGIQQAVYKGIVQTKPAMQVASFPITKTESVDAPKTK